MYEKSKYGCENQRQDSNTEYNKRTFACPRPSLRATDSAVSTRYVFIVQFKSCTVAWFTCNILDNSCIGIITAYIITIGVSAVQVICRRIRRFRVSANRNKRIIIIYRLFFYNNNDVYTAEISDFALKCIIIFI